MASTIDDVNGDDTKSKVFFDKFKELYNFTSYNRCEM